MTRRNPRRRTRALSTETTEPPRKKQASRSRNLKTLKNTTPTNEVRQSKSTRDNNFSYDSSPETILPSPPIHITPQSDTTNEESFVYESPSNYNTSSTNY